MRLAMLQVDLDAPDFEIEQSIRQDCSKIGRVRVITIHRSPIPFALIHMATSEQTYELTSRFGGSAFGTCALVHLKQMRDRTFGGTEGRRGVTSAYPI